MNNYAGLVQQALFFGCIVVALTALSTAVIFPLLRAKFHVLDARTRASILLGVCSLPIVSTFLVLFAALLPSLLQLMGIENDHCLGHTDGHQHFCLIHRPTMLDSQPLGFLAALFLLLIVLIIARVLLDLVRTRQFWNVLRAYPVVKREGAVYVMETAIPLAFTIGIFNPRIYLSTGLLQTLSLEQQALLVAHEQEHLERYDSLRSLVARTLSMAHLPWIRKELLSQLHLASEQACDVKAASCAESPHAVAELLLKIERMYQHHFPARAPLVLNLLGNNESTLPQRIEALLSSTPCVHLPKATIVSIVLVSIVALVTHDLLHDGLEHVLELLQG